MIRSTPRFGQSAVALAAALLAVGAQAIEIDTGNPDFILRWDNTVKVQRRGAPEGRVAGLCCRCPARPTLADRTTQPGRRRPQLQGADLQPPRPAHRGGPHRPSGTARAQRGAAWYDAVYNRSDRQPGLHAPTTGAGQRVHARHTRPAWAARPRCSTPSSSASSSWATGRPRCARAATRCCGARACSSAPMPSPAGRRRWTWSSWSRCPNATFKEVIRPAGKLSGQVQVSADVSLGAYLQTSGRAPG